VTAALSVVRDVADTELDRFRVGYVAGDGTQHRLSLVDAWAVRFEVMAPAWRFTARKGKDDRSLAPSGNRPQHSSPPCVGVRRGAGAYVRMGVGARRPGDGGNDRDSHQPGWRAYP
jgi:hypothetical protein